MIIAFEHEKKNSKLKNADGYLDCEKVIIHNIKKHLFNGFSESVIEACLKKLLRYFQDLTGKNKDTVDCANYRYAAGFANTLMATPYWHTRIKTTIL